MFRRLIIAVLCCSSATAATLCAAMRARSEMPVPTRGGILACCADRPVEKTAPVGPHECACCELPGLTALPPAAKVEAAKPVLLQPIAVLPETHWMPGDAARFEPRPACLASPPARSLFALHVQMTC